MKNSKYTNHTITERIYDFMINISYIIIPIISFIITLSILYNFRLVLDSQEINTLSNAFITVSGILPGILLTFIGNIVNLPSDNEFLKNIKTQGYYELLYKIIFFDIAVWVITLIFSIIIIANQVQLLVNITISFFIAAVTLFLFGFWKLAQITILTSR